MRVLDTADATDVQALAFSPDGGRLAVGLKLRGARVHDLAAGAAPVRFGEVPHFVASSLTFAGGGVVYGITRDGRTGFDAATGRVVSKGPTHRSVPMAQGFVEAVDGTRLVTHSHHFPSMRLAGWTPAEGRWGLAWVIEQGISSSPALVGDRVVQIGCTTPGGWDYQLVVRDAATGSVVGTGAYDYGMLARPHVRPDGRQIVAPHEMTLVIWDARVLGKPVLVRNDSRRHFTAAAYHPSGRYLFTTSNDATVTVWDADNWVRVKRFAWEIGRLRSVAVSADGLLAAAGSDLGRVVVWDVDV